MNTDFQSLATLAFEYIVCKHCLVVVVPGDSAGFAVDRPTSPYHVSPTAAPPGKVTLVFAPHGRDLLFSQ